MMAKFQVLKTSNTTEYTPTPPWSLFQFYSHKDIFLLYVSFLTFLCYFPSNWRKNTAQSSTISQSSFRFADPACLKIWEKI